MSSLAELKAQHEQLLQEIDETMSQTFRARGAKLTTLTAKLEELDVSQVFAPCCRSSGSLMFFFGVFFVFFPFFFFFFFL
jgi:hypothetical protein